LLTGVEAARAAWVASLDGDGQNDPGDILRLWTTLGSRRSSPRLGLLLGRRRHRRDPWSKRLSSRIANGVRSRLLGDRTPDSGCGLKLMHRATFLALPRFDHMHRFLPALYQSAGCSVLSIPVRHRPRRAGRPHYGTLDRLRVGLVDLLGVLWLRSRQLPLAQSPDKAALEILQREADLVR
jgi:dolichol-phosphate mannosyltransferase